MRYLIDGSNLLGYMRLLGKDHADISLLAMIDRFCVPKRHRAIVVFDALPRRESQSQFSFGNRITIKVAPPGNEPDRADNVILAMLKDFDSRDNIRIITDDNQLISAVRTRGFREIRCREFVGMITGGTRTSASSDEKVAAARGIDNREFLRIWSGDGPDGEDIDSMMEGT